MTLIAAIPVLMLIAGLIMYGMCTNPKLAEVGRILFAAAAFSIAFEFAHRLVNVLH